MTKVKLFPATSELPDPGSARKMLQLTLTGPGKIVTLSLLSLPPICPFNIMREINLPKMMGATVAVYIPLLRSETCAVMFTCPQS